MKPAYKEKYPNLFQPLKIKKGIAPFKNRILLGPIGYHVNFGVNDGQLNAFGLDFWTGFVRGGFSAVTLPMPFASAEKYGEVFSMDPDKDNQAKAHMLQRSVHAYQGKTFVELYHQGRCAAAVCNKDVPVLAASDGEYQGHRVKGLDADDMDTVEAQYREYANQARRSGFDGIQLHFAHGWLIHDFLSPLSNKRTDEYGGSVENRCRFPLRVLKAVREAAGENMIIELRLDGSDMIKGGIVPEDTAQQILIFQEYADMVQITCGTRLDMTTRAQMHPTYYLPNNHNVWASDIIRNTPGIRIPVGVVGSISEPESAEEILASGKADYVVVCRSGIADQDWVNKIREGREEDIRPCLRCCYCLDHGRRKARFKNRELAVINDTTFDGGCAVNPFSHQGISKKLFPCPKTSKTVAVVGGGIAGLNAALSAAERGHKVTVYEKTDHLGGQLVITQNLWFKKEQKAYLEWLERQVRKNPNITLKLKTSATPEMISEANPDAAIIAVGSRQKLPDIPGANKARMYFGAFHNPDRFGKRVVIVGSGVGSELAIYLTENGHECTVIDEADFIAPDIELTVRVSLLATLEEKKIKTLESTKAVEIVDEGVIVTNPEKGKYLLEADTVILATGTEPLEDAGDAFADAAFDVIVVGDALGDGTADIPHAVETGFNAGYIL